MKEHVLDKWSINSIVNVLVAQLSSTFFGTAKFFFYLTLASYPINPSGGIGMKRLSSNLVAQKTFLEITQRLP